MRISLGSYLITAIDRWRTKPSEREFKPSAQPVSAVRTVLPHLVLLCVFQLAGEMLVRLLAVPFPGPLLGMLLLLATLALRRGPSAGLAKVSRGLIDHLGLMFVPAGAAVGSVLAGLGSDGLAIAAAVFVSTLGAIVVTGVVATWLERKVQVSDGYPGAVTSEAVVQFAAASSDGDAIDRPPDMR